VSDDPDAQRRRIRRAKEILEGAGWVFDEYVNAKMAAVLATKPEDVEGRERLVRAAQVASQLKIGLLREIEQYEDTQMLRERREQQMEKHHGGHAVN
jgi:hypothetical protein